MPFVLDASITAAWALMDESHPLADRLLADIVTDSALVPGIWWYEMRNLLVVNERRKRLSMDESNAFLKVLDSFPIHTDEIADEQAILGYARRHKLSFYDAAYLDVAVRNQLALATLDTALSTAAKAIGVTLLA